MKTKQSIRQKTGLFLSAILILLSFLVFAHGDEDHGKKKKETKDTVSTEVVQEKVADKHDHSAHGELGHHANKPLKAELQDFPTLHPLVVHFPIVLLLLAALSQIAGLFFFKNELNWVTLFLIAGGFAGAYIAGSYVHPHTAGLSDLAEKILLEHENYASYTTWLGGIAFLLKAASHFFLKRKLWGEIIVALVLAASAYTVSTAGHYGAQLIHIEGVGAKGEFIETDGNGHDHKH